MSQGKTLYIEANSGISGDMFVAALLDLGAPEDVLLSVLDSIPVDGYQVVISRKKRAAI
ncbi:MAG: nickel insertion protein, partial [Eubacterium sp.]|nr:nickel insertion protein [Eubacterium sp.]